MLTIVPLATAIAAYNAAPTEANSALVLECALAQYNSNLGWHTDRTKAELCLEAIRWLIVNQPASYSIAGRSIQKNLTQLEDERRNLERFIGATQVRAFGRRRMIPGPLANSVEGARLPL